MTVKQLKEALKEMPDDLPVFVQIKDDSGSPMWMVNLSRYNEDEYLGAATLEDFDENDKEGFDEWVARSKPCVALVHQHV